MRLLNKVNSVLNRIKNTIGFYYKGAKKADLIIYDNVYPHPVSGFRFEEITSLIEEFKNVKLLLDGKTYPALKTAKYKHKQHIHQLVQRYTFINRNQIVRNNWFVNVNAKLFYCIFINNIFENIDWLEKYKIPYVFTLYPGGGFEINDPVSDKKLIKVLGSSLFRKVIVTQEYTFKYLKKKKFCDVSKIHLLFGGVVPQTSIHSELEKKTTYPESKKTLDVCFCAAKYMKEGKDKGYDVFIKAAKELAKKYDFVRFHVIGGFDENDILLDEISHLVSFYGYVDYSDLKGVFKRIDILVSPNKPFILGKGAFDGFPLGTAVEAALNGVLVLAADELNENRMFENQNDIIIIESTWESVCYEIESLIAVPERIQQISSNSKEKFKIIYSNNFQMGKRIELISKEIEAL
jgi:glycosyltransferase involved in cell wall biosynthesis